MNDYDAAVAATLGGEPAPTPADPAAAARFGMQQAVGTNADLQAELKRVAEATGVPVSTAAAMPEEVKRQAALGAIDFDGLAVVAPATARLLADIGKAKLAHDDVGTLTQIEQAVRAFVEPGNPPQPVPREQRGRSYIGASTLAGVQDLLGVGAKLLDKVNPFTTSPEDAAVLFRNDPAGLQRFNASPANFLGRFTDAMSQASEQTMREVSPQSQRQYGGLEYATTDSAKAAYLSPVRVVGDALRSLPTSTAMALSIVLTRGAAAKAEADALAAGATPIVARQAGVEAAVQTMARYGAGSEGAVGYAQQANQTVAQLQQLSDEKMQAAPEYKRLLAEGYTPEAARQVVTQQTGEQAGLLAGIVDAAVNHVGGLILGRIIGEGGKLLPRVARGAATEAATEFAQSGGEQLGQNIATQRNVDPQQSLLDGVLESMVQGLVVGGVTGGAMAGLGGAHRSEVTAKQSRQASTDLERILQLAQQSKLAQRDPQAFAAFIREAAPDGEVYVGAQELANVLNQSGVSPDQLRAVAPTTADQLDPQNLVPGADVRIPLDELASIGPEVATQLLQHVRQDEQAMSPTEVHQYLQTEGERLQAHVERELSREFEDRARQRQVDEVQAHFEQQLAAANRFSPDVNKAYASLLANFYATQAQRAGTTADELLSRYNLKIVAQTPAGALLDQEVPLRQGEAEITRGSFNPQTNTLALLKGADLSTFIHESGHFFLEVQADLANRILEAEARGDVVGEGERGIAADMQTLLTWMGVPSLQAWRDMTLDQRREQHEQFARGFERYLMEGVAPNQQLQSIFSRVRSWMLQVYRTLLNLHADLSDEVRQVMGRMLASDITIKEAEAARAMGPLFQTPEQAGMTLEEFHAYQALAAQATAAAGAKLDADLMKDMRWLSRARNKALRVAQREAEGLRSEIEREVRAEVMSEPIYQVWAFLTGRRDVIPPGTRVLDGMALLDSGRLRTSIVKEMDPKAYERLHALGMTSEERGLHPDLVAEIDGLGFTSGQQLVHALYLADDPQTVIEGLTDQRMLERHGDITSQEALNRAADAAVHNELRARVIAAELDALDRANTVREKHGKGTADMMARAARDFARQIIGRQKIRDVRPGQYAAAEARSSRLAMQSMGKSTEEAAMHKRNALVNNAAAREAYKAREDVQRGLEYLRRVEKADSIAPEYQDQIDALLERYDLSPATTQKEARRRATLAEWIETQRDMGIEPDVPDYLLRDAQLVSFKDLTVEEFRGLIDTVRQIEHLGRLKKKLLTAQDQRDFDRARDTIVASILAHAGDRSADTRTPNTRLGESLVSLRRFWASHIKAATWARIMDGGRDGGPVWEYVIRAANAAGDKEIAMRAQATQDAARLLAPVLKLGPMGGKGDFFPTIGRSLNREARLAIALNYGNEGNIQRLLDGEGWRSEQLQPVLQSLTAAEWHFVQQVWDYFEGYRPEIAAKERRVMGREPEWVEPKPMIVKTVDGEQLTLRGGYYPIKYDPRASERAEAHAEAEGARQQMKGAYTSATTRRSFTKARAEEVTGRPLLYSLDGFYNGVQEVIHDLSWHEFLIDANRLMRDKGIAAAIRSTYGPEVHQQFKQWLQDVAQGEQPARNAGETALGWVRQGVSVSALGFNVMSALIQPLGITQSIPRIGAKWVGRGIAKFIGSPLETVDAINEASTFMRTRNMTRLRELAEVRAQVKGAGPGRQALDGAAYFLMLRAQQLVDVPTWWGAYEKAIADGNDQPRAVALADQAVIDSQGGGATKDLSAIERGGPALKLFTTFYSFFNTALNVGVAQTMTNESKAKTAADYLLLFVAPVVLGALLKDALTPGAGGDDDDPEKLAKRLAGEEISYLFGLLFGVREVSGAAQELTGTAQYPTDYAGPSGLRPIADLAKLAKQVHQGEMDDGLRRAIVRTAGEVLRLPAAQINRSVDGAQALADGKTHNPLALVFGYEEKR